MNEQLKHRMMGFVFRMAKTKLFFRTNRKIGMLNRFIFSSKEGNLQKLKKD